MGFVERYVGSKEKEIQRLKTILPYCKHSKRRQKILKRIKRNEDFLELWNNPEES